MKKRRLNILFVFFVITLFVFTFNVTSSRYMGQIESKSEDVNAIPILNLSNLVFNKEITNILPGFVTESDFYVSNYDDTNTNEVLMKYYMKVQTSNEIPIKISLTDGDGTEITLDQEGKTPEKTLIYDNQMQDKYHIKLEWNEKDNNFKYAEKNVTLNIEVVAVQVVEGF